MVEMERGRKQKEKETEERGKEERSVWKIEMAE